MEIFILYFSIYSIIGWICECIYCAAIDRVWVNRGFLNGPVCPVYGVGSLFVIFLLGRFKDDIVLLFIVAVIITTLVEYVTAIILEKLFNLKWWDYSNYKFNYKGRICLLNSVLFGIGSVILVKFIQPLVATFINGINVEYGTIISLIFALVFLVDFVVTVLSLMNMKNVIERMCTIKEEFKLLEITVEKFSYSDLKKNFYKMKDKTDLNEIKVKFDEFSSILKELKENSAVQKRLLRAFPNVKSLKYGKQFKDLKLNLFDYWNKKKR